MPAKAVVQSLKRNGDYQHILDSRAKGDAAWIELAPTLYEGTDAGDSEDLETTLASALPKNAKAAQNLNMKISSRFNRFHLCQTFDKAK